MLSVTPIVLLIVAVIVCLVIADRAEHKH